MVFGQKYHFYRCYSQGETIEETLKNIKEAIKAHILALKAEGAEMPAKKEFVIGRVKIATVG